MVTWIFGPILLMIKNKQARIEQDLIEARKEAEKNQRLTEARAKVFDNPDQERIDASFYASKAITNFIWNYQDRLRQKMVDLKKEYLILWVFSSGWQITLETSDLSGSLDWVHFKIKEPVNPNRCYRNSEIICRSTCHEKWHVFYLMALASIDELQSINELSILDQISEHN